jgi:cytidylate kinase
MEQVLVIHGPQGSGKSVAAKLVAQRFSRTAYMNKAQASSRFGLPQAMERANLIVLEEFDDHGVLKNYCTSKRVQVDVMGEDSLAIRNRSGFIITAEKPVEDARFVINTTSMEVFSILSEISL